VLYKDREERIETSVKEALAKAFLGDTSRIREFTQKQEARTVFEATIDERLVRVEQFTSIRYSVIPGKVSQLVYMKVHRD
jgi:hypothetical protein